jgi:hypothetical protein
MRARHERKKPGKREGGGTSVYKRRNRREPKRGQPAVSVLHTPRKTMRNQIVGGGTTESKAFDTPRAIEYMPGDMIDLSTNTHKQVWTTTDRQGAINLHGTWTYGLVVTPIKEKDVDEIVVSSSM